MLILNYTFLVRRTYLDFLPSNPPRNFVARSFQQLISEWESSICGRKNYDERVPRGLGGNISTGRRASELKSVGMPL